MPTRWTAEAQVIAAGIRQEFEYMTQAGRAEIARLRAQDYAADGLPSSALAHLAAARILQES